MGALLSIPKLSAVLIAAFVGGKFASGLGVKMLSVAGIKTLEGGLASGLINVVGLETFTLVSSLANAVGLETFALLSSLVSVVGLETLALVAVGGGGVLLSYAILKEAIRLAKDICQAMGQRSSRNETTGRSASRQSNSGSSKQKADRLKQKNPDKQRRSRSKSPLVRDPFSDDVEGIREPWYHFARRLTRFVRLGGISQYISEQTEFPRANVFFGGRSEYQDRSCSTSGHQAAHVVRVRIHPDVRTRSPTIFERVATFVGHTHEVAQYVNAWHLIGGDVDRLQERFLKEILSIDFRGDLTPEGRDILRRLHQAFLDTFDNAIRSGRYTAEQVNALKLAVDVIREISIDDLFKYGRDGLDFI